MTVPDRTAEVAGLFGVCKQAVRTCADRGELPSAWVQGRRRFPAHAVAELAQRHHIPLPDRLRAATGAREEPV